MFAKFPHHSEAAKTRCGSSFLLPVRTKGFTALLSISFCVNLKNLLTGGEGCPGRSSQLDIGWFYFHPRERNPHPLTELFMMLMQHVSTVTQSCSTLCKPMDYSTPGFPVHHQLWELPQTHVHRVGDAIQPSHPLSSHPGPGMPGTTPFSSPSPASEEWVSWPGDAEVHPEALCFLGIHVRGCNFWKLF